MTGSDHTKLPGNVIETFQDFWANRPVRPLHGGKVAGVSAALGHRYGIDPVLIRVAFVVGFIYGGAGAVLYLLGWLLLPKENAPGQDGKPAHHGPSGVFTVILVFVLIGASTSALHGVGLLGIAIGLVALYLLHSNYGSAKQPAVAQTSAGTTPASQSTVDTNETEPPSWDPLGAAPFAWDLPEPSEKPHEPEPSRPAVTLVTTALALIAGGLSLAAGVTLASALAIALAVLGVGMVFAAFFNRGRGLIAAAIPVGVLALAFSMIPAGPWNGVASYEEHPTVVNAVQPDYRVTAGDVHLDLRGLRIADGPEVKTRAEVVLGDIRVTVPRDADVDVRCTAELGAVQCLGERQDGWHSQVEAHDQGKNGPGGGHIVLDLKAGTGNVEVTRD